MKYLSFLLIALLLFSCEGKLDVTPTGGSNAPLPEYNFLVRQLPGTGKTDSLAANDTLRAEIYLKQLNYQAPGETYRVIISLPTTLDGQIGYKGVTYRSGDWIPVAYADLSDFATVLTILPVEAKPGTHTISLVCKDRQDHSKNASLSITIP